MEIKTQQQFQQVANLSFCYLCGKKFDSKDDANRDHVPPKCVFANGDRNPPLILKTHCECNSAHKITDESIGQLVALQRNYVTPNPKNRRLKMERYSGREFGAVTNVSVVKAIWRYIRGFHAALYREPLFLGTKAGTITTPFTRGHIVANDLVLEAPKQEQHFWIVRVIKNQRAVGNVDQIVSNNSKVIYECVWVLAENVTAVKLHQRPIAPRRACFFALNIYGWKRLGNVRITPERGCVGAYFTPNDKAPTGASLHIESAPPVVNHEPWDPFGA